MTRDCRDREKKGERERERVGGNKRKREVKLTTKLHLALPFLTDKY